MDMQDLEQTNETTKKVIMQKVARLEYGHQMNIERVEQDAQKILREEMDFHTEN